jgi:hypothetical protein
LFYHERCRQIHAALADWVALPVVGGIVPIRHSGILALGLYRILSALMSVLNFHFNLFVAVGVLLLLVLLAGYTWAVYFGFPFFRQRARHQRIFISAGLALMPVCLTGFAGALVVNAIFFSKSDQRVESVTLPSGEVLENHTYCDEGGWPGGARINELFLKNPATGTSERVDANGDLDYPYSPSLLERFPHPQEIVREGEKVLLIGPYVCKRWIWKTGPEWYIVRFDMAAGDAKEYLRSFVKTNSTFFTSPYSGPEEFLHYQIENLDLGNNVLTIKRIPWNAQTDPPEFRDFPDYLVYSAVGYNGKSGYQFPWKFDEARTRAKNGPRWEKPVPFRMALDYSVITFPAQAGFMPHGEKRDVALAHAGAREIAATSLELSDREVRGAECKYVILTNAITDKIEAMYGYACAETNRFYIVWEPRDPAAWYSAATLNLDDWAPVGEDGFGRNIHRDEYIRLREIEP